TDLFIGIHEWKSALCHQGRFVKSAEDQLQFSGIRVDVANGKYSRFTGCKVYRIHYDLVTIEVEAPVRDGAEFRTESEERNQVICRNGDALFLFIGYRHGVEYALALKLVEVAVQQHVDAAGCGKFVYLSRGVGRAAKRFVSMHQRYAFGDVGQVYCPVEC